MFVLRATPRMINDTEPAIVDLLAALPGKYGWKMVALSYR